MSSEVARPAAQPGVGGDLPLAPGCRSTVPKLPPFSWIGDSKEGRDHPKLAGN